MERIESQKTVLYELFSRPLGSVDIQPPKGWNSDTRGFERDKDSRGITNKTEIDLEFYGNGAEFISTIYKGFGLQEKILLTKYERNLYSVGEEWVLRYVQELDLTSYKNESRTGKVTVKATEGGLFDDIKHRESDEYNLINTESADGVHIGEIITHPFQPVPRGIFQESLFQEMDLVGYRINGGWTGTQVISMSRHIPAKLIYNSDTDSVLTPQTNNAEPTDLNPMSHNFGYAVGDDMEYWQLFYHNETELYKGLRLKVDIEGVIEQIIQSTTELQTQDDFSVAIIKTLKNAEDVHKITEVIELNYYEGILSGDVFSGEYDGEIEIEPSGGMTVVVATHQYGYALNVVLNFTKARLSIQDITEYPISVSRCIKPLDLFNRLVAKITGKTNLVRSSIFEPNGEYESMVVDNGFWARGFPDSIINDGETEEIQFNTSFKDAFESFNYLEPLCWFVDIEGDKQVLRIEKATYTMHNFVSIQLGAVDDIGEESSKNDWFSSIELGHEGSLEYEEINGLDEPNGKSLFTTPVKNSSKYSVISKYRFDSVGYELIRRKNYENYPKEDTPRDSDLWIHDAKKVGTFYTHNLYSDVNMSLPSGIFSPETAWNLRLSPMNRLMYGHGYSVKRGLYHNPDKLLRFASSNSNMNLRTTLGVTLHEGGSLRIGDMEKPRVEATLTTLKFKMDQLKENMFLGRTKVGNLLIPNYFGLIEYEEKGIKKYGRLVKLDADEESKLTLINAKL